MLSDSHFRSDCATTRRYFSTIVLVVMFFCCASSFADEWATLFDGKTLVGWKPSRDNKQFSIADRAIVGRSSSETHFLHTTETYGDFELELEVKLHDTDLNSGIQIRTQLTRTNDAGTARPSIHGPQVDLGKSPGRSGHIFNQGNGAWITAKEELTRNEVMVNGQWNKLRVLAVGPRIQTWINGKQVADVADDEAYAKYSSGVIALQVHGVRNSPEKARHVSFRAIRARKIERDSVSPLDESRDSRDSAVEGKPVVLEKPNIVLLFIDDWAWNGTPVPMNDGMANSRMPVVQMPNVERLAREGMKFTNAYASPQCSPSRVCVQTGQSSPRNGFTVFMNDRGQDYFDEKGYPDFPVIPCVSDMTIDKDTMTIPEALKPLGYVSAHIGKWHMRGDPGDEGYVLHDGDTSNKPGNTLPAGANQRLPADLTDPKLMFSVTEKALGFMSKQAKAGQPFYLQISHYAMHEGRECLPATRTKYTQHPLVQAYYKKIGKTADTVRRKEDPAIWLGMGEDLDGRIGAVLDRISDLGIEDNTYVVLVSDNGYRHKELQLTKGLKQPHHAAKWWAWQGGIRVPMIVRGPGIKAGSVFKGNVVNYDFLPTFVDWAGGDNTVLKNIDGVSLVSCMAGKPQADAFLNRNLYFHYPHYRTTMPHSAVVSGSRKLLHFYERPDIPMLFDLTQDTGEVHNIAATHPEEHQRLYDEMMVYFEKVGARIPKQNPTYDAATYRSSKEYEKRTQWGPFAGSRSLDEDER